ncbi:target of Nesh-SH3 isoform X11 [Crotalus tigris]|uniref:target of Nesh-SH3 isoform X11 n=1 Tax=Crotalus tigris TaxID=88082 RepID=UPI00192F7C24|nr:target of Nesh-SH3 isoform X11 [Crotalus tigris]
MISRLVFLLFCGHFAQILGNAGKLPRVKKQSLKVQINVTNDAVCMRYIHPTPSTKLEGFILGYGSSFFSNQYIPLPSNGKMYITEVDAEPRYLIVVRPAPVPNNKKSCSGISKGKTKKPKPLQLVIGTLTPTSVFLSWGILVNPKHDWTTMNNCPNDRFYTVRYREKDKSKKWILQLCPSTETVVDNLKPNTIYEFGVKDNIDDGIWSKSFIHKVVIPGKNKENGQLQNNYKFPKIHTQFIPDSKTLVPVKVIKQVLQNITHRTQSEILQRPPLSGPILVHLIIPDFNATKEKPPSSSRFDIFEKPKQILAKNKTQEWLPESKISEVKEITPKSQIDLEKSKSTAAGVSKDSTVSQDLEKSKSTAAGVSKDSTVSQAHTESELESSTPSKAPMTEMPPVTLDLRKFLGIPKARPSPTPHMPTESSVLKKMQPVPSESETPVLKTIQTKAAVTDEPTLESFPYKTSKTLDWPRATLVSTLPSLKQNIPKISRITEKLKASPAEKESQEKTTASSIFKTPELPRTTMVPRGQKFPVSKPQLLPHLEEPKITLAVTNKLIPLPDATKISVTDGHPVATMASKEINPVPSKSKEFDYTKPEEPDRKLASYKPSPVPPRFKEPVYIMPEVPDRKHVSTEDDHYLPKVLTTPELPITKSVSYESSPVPSKFKESGYILPEVPDKKPVSADYDNCLLKVFTTPELQITKHASYKPSPVPPKFKEPESIMPEVPDRKHVSTEEENYLPKVLTTTERPITKPASYEESSVPSKFKEPGYIMLEEPDRKAVSAEDDNYLPKVLTITELPITKSASYKPSLIPPKFKEPDYGMPEVPDRKHVSTEDDNYLPKLLTTTKLSITKHVSTEDDNYLPKVLTTPEPPITKSVSTEDDNYLPKVLTTPEFPITKPVSTEDDNYLPKVLTTPELLITKPASYKSSPIPPKFKEPEYTMPEVPDRKHVSYEPTSIPSKVKEPDYILPEVPERKHVSTEDDNYFPKILTTTERPITKPASYKQSSVPSTFQEPSYIPPEVQDTKHVSTEDDNYLPNVLTTTELPITKPASYKPSPVPPKFKEPESIMPEVPDRKHASYKPSSVLPKFKEPESIMPEVPDRKHVSTEDDNYLPNVLTTTELPITKPVSTEDDNYLPKILTTTERPITKPVSYKPSSVPSTFKEPSYFPPEVPDTKHVSTEDDNYLPKVLTTPELIITESASYKPSPVPPKFKEPESIMPEVPDRKHVSTEDDNYLLNVLTTTELPITKPASYKPRPVLPKFKEPESIMPEVPDRKHVSTEDDNYLPKVFTTPELLITESASYKPSPVLPKFKETESIMPEIPVRKHVSTEDDNYLPKVLTTTKHPITKPVSYEPTSIPSKVKEPDYILPEVPDRKHVSYKPSPVPSTFKEPSYITPEVPDTKYASYKPSPVLPKFKEPEYMMPEVPDRKHVSTEDYNYLPKVLSTTKRPITKPVSTEDDNYLPKILTRTELPITKPASYESIPAPSKFKEPDSILSEVRDRKHVLEPITFSNELPIVDTKTKHHISITKTTINPLLLPKSDIGADVEEVIFKTEQAKSSTAPKETHQVPTRPKTSSSPDITPTKSSLNVKHHDPSKPKSPPGQKTQQSKPDPKETRLLPSKPKPSDKQEKNKTKPGSSKLNNKVTVTKTPHLKKVVHRTTPAPPRTRTPGGPSWSKKPRGEKLTNEDVAKPLHPSSSTKSSIPIDSTVVRKKPDPVATLPGSPRPPLAPARPTPIRRKPLPPNNVTGKPGRSGNVLMPRASSILTTSIAKPTWPSSLVKTNSPKKLPTAAASPDYNNPMFSSIPTSDTDIAGTPRYTGDHVKYLKKKDDEPCSITDTIQHFPSDMEDNSDMATSAPQKPPTNLTVVTVEGCPSFVVLDWKKPENETVTEYKVVSTENGGTVGKDKSIITTNQTHSTVENLKPNTSYEFVVIPSNPLGEGPSSESKPFRTESADPRVTESISMGKDAIWTEVSFNSDDYSECKGKQYVKRTWYKKFVGVQLCNSLRYKIYLSDTLTGTFYNIGDQRGHGEDHCQFVDSYFDGKTGQMLPSDQLPTKDGYFRAVRQEPVHFGKIGAGTHSTYVNWYECGTTIPGKW